MTITSSTPASVGIGAATIALGAFFATVIRGRGVGELGTASTTGAVTVTGLGTSDVVIGAGGMAGAGVVGVLMGAAIGVSRVVVVNATPITIPAISVAAMPIIDRVFMAGILRGSGVTHSVAARCDGVAVRTATRTERICASVGRCAQSSRAWRTGRGRAAAESPAGSGSRRGGDA